MKMLHKNFSLQKIILDNIPPKKKIFFCSDLHLGSHTDTANSEAREQKIIQWLTHIEKTAYAIFFLGDIFDFWFEYEKVVPKGYIKFQAKIQALCHQKINIFFFTGNHDLWLGDYFKKELGVEVVKNMACLKVKEKKFLIGHGDDLVQNKLYQYTKKYIYQNKQCTWIFKKIHPDIGIKLAQYISGKKKKVEMIKNDPIFDCCKKKFSGSHYDYYLFGHIHYPYTSPIHKSQYYNVGDWLYHYSYGVYDGQIMKLVYFK